MLLPVDNGRILDTSISNRGTVSGAHWLWAPRVALAVAGSGGVRLTLGQRNTFKNTTIKSIGRTRRVIEWCAREVRGKGGDSIGGGARQKPTMMMTGTTLPSSFILGRQTNASSSDNDLVKTLASRDYNNNNNDDDNEDDLSGLLATHPLHFPVSAGALAARRTRQRRQQPMQTFEAKVKYNQQSKAKK
jgi:hypothetical protein